MGKLRTDEEYQKIFLEIGDERNLTIEDMKWIDQNVILDIINKKVFEYTLNFVEQELAKIVSKKRQEESRAAGHTNTPYGKDQDTIDLNGYGAELAFCHLFNIYPDTTTHARVGTADCLGHKGISIDVKNTEYPNGHLLVKSSKKDSDVEMYALMVGSFPTYKFVGYAYKKEIIKDENLKDFGGYNQPGYALTQDKLHKL